MPRSAATTSTVQAKVPHDVVEARFMAQSVPEPAVVEPAAPAVAEDLPEPAPPVTISSHRHRPNRSGRVVVAVSMDGGEADARGPLRLVPAGPQPSQQAPGPVPAAPILIPRKPQRPQVVVRLLAGDETVRDQLAARLGHDDASRENWRRLVDGFRGALAATAIDGGWLDFPDGHPFWSQFHPDEARQIARSLAARGFRNDGRGEFEDERFPVRHDLAMAVGAAGLLPLKFRFWPDAAETRMLWREARVACDEMLRVEAPSLSLGEIVALLAWRSEPLTELWNEWPSIRQVLLSFDAEPPVAGC
jgi:hypothetical protein